MTVNKFGHASRSGIVRDGATGENRLVFGEHPRSPQRQNPDLALHEYYSVQKKEMRAEARIP